MDPKRVYVNICKAVLSSKSKKSIRKTMDLKLFDRPGMNPIVFKSNGIEVTLKDILGCGIDEWLGDNIIYSYLLDVLGKAMTEKCVVQLKQLTPKLTISNWDRFMFKRCDIAPFVLLPWNPSNYHWTLVVLCGFQKRRKEYDKTIVTKVYVLDPLNSKATSTSLEILKKLVASYVDYWGGAPPAVPSIEHVRKVQTQTNTSDCGIWVILYCCVLIEYAFSFATNPCSIFDDDKTPFFDKIRTSLPDEMRIKLLMWALEQYELDIRRRIFPQYTK